MEREEQTRREEEIRQRALEEKREREQKELEEKEVESDFSEEKPKRKYRHSMIVHCRSPGQTPFQALRDF